MMYKVIYRGPQDRVETASHDCTKLEHVGGSLTLMDDQRNIVAIYADGNWISVVKEETPK